MGEVRPIRITRLRVHNLKNVSLDIPRNQLVVVSGVSGSGKSSLAFDTLFAEGQRRYIETFSAYTRQFLERVDRPDADAIENIPPAIAIRQRAATRNSRSTVGSVTEINDFLRLLFAKIGRVFCQQCGQEIGRDTAQSVLTTLSNTLLDQEILITFPLEPTGRANFGASARSLVADGFIRLVVGSEVWNLGESPPPKLARGARPRVVVDRAVTGRTPSTRLLDSLEIAFAKGNGRCHVLVALPEEAEQVAGIRARAERSGRRVEVDKWIVFAFSSHRRCEQCSLEYPEPEPRLFNSNNPLGACPTCKGFGDVTEIDMDRVVPDRSKSLRDGAIAPWNTPAYQHELEELLDLADDYGIPVDVPFQELGARQLKLIHEGVPERKFGGLRGFFNWLERKKYKMHIRVFLSRWRGYHSCPTCHGRRLQPAALATRIGGQNISEFLSLEIRHARQFLDNLRLTDTERTVGQVMLQQIANRLGYLDEVGVGYLTLDRPLRTLSGGESQRVALTKALGAGLVNTLYVLDEPSIGLHERDTHRLLKIVEALRDSHNSVVVVEHDWCFLRAADHLIDMGPGAGEAGGEVVFEGPVSQVVHASTSVTGAFLNGSRSIAVPGKRRPAGPSRLVVRGARGNNLKNIDAEFPLGLLCVVTGVSGSGKSTLVEQTLYAGLCRALRRPGPTPADHDSISGAEMIEEVLLVDQSPIGRTSRSNPATYVKAFDEIRRAFAETGEARLRNYGPGHFSFNVEGGRCSACQGQGVQIIDMQFLADISITCPECGGLRFRQEILDVKFRGKNIAEVLDMPVREAIDFFRGRTNLIQALTPLLSVGLDYLRLGQPADTLSGGEAQRLKLAGQLAKTTSPRTLLILDEPTTGLHSGDIQFLLRCFDALLSVGHSLIVVEHNMDLIKCADWVIDLGPEAAAEGGRIMASGTPEEVARVQESHTARFLRQVLQR